jgi:hypothetical protein
MHEQTEPHLAPAQSDGPFIERQPKPGLYITVFLVTVAIATAHAFLARHDQPQVSIKGNGNLVEVTPATKIDIRRGGKVTHIKIVRGQQGKLVDAGGKSCSAYKGASACMHSDHSLMVRSQSGVWSIIAGTPNAADRAQVQRIEDVYSRSSR